MILYPWSKDREERGHHSGPEGVPSRRLTVSSSSPAAQRSGAMTTVNIRLIALASSITAAAFLVKLMAETRGNCMTKLVSGDCEATL